MTIKSKNVVVLQSSFAFNVDRSRVIYQANADLYVEGNAYPDLITPKTIFNLECPSNDIINIQTVTELQIAAWVNINYPTI